MPAADHCASDPGYATFMFVDASPKPTFFVVKIEPGASAGLISTTGVLPLGSIRAGWLAGLAQLSIFLFDT